MAFEKVMKFGGAALADGAAVERVCAIVRDRGGGRPIVVVSAHQGVTAMLDSIARAATEGVIDGDRVRIRHRGLLRQLGLDAELLNRYFAELVSLLGEIARRRQLLAGERDLVLSYGERMSARVVAHALKQRGVPATPADAFDIGLTTDSNHGAARPLPESRSAVRAALLEMPGVPVVTGFLAKDRHGNLTTLGRNGSDLTAALVAEAVGASSLELWKAVAGMMTADPALVPDARVIDRLSFEDAAAFAAQGAEILHPEALAPALRAGVAVRFLDVRDPRSAGTTLDARAGASGPVGIAVRRIPFAGADAEERALVALVGGVADVRPRAVAALSRAGVDVVETLAAQERATERLVLRAIDVERAVRVLHAEFFAAEGVRIP